MDCEPVNAIVLGAETELAGLLIGRLLRSDFVHAVYALSEEAVEGLEEDLDLNEREKERLRPVIQSYSLLEKTLGALAGLPRVVAFCCLNVQLVPGTSDERIAVNEHKYNFDYPVRFIAGLLFMEVIRVCLLSSTAKGQDSRAQLNDEVLEWWHDMWTSYVPSPYPKPPTLTLFDPPQMLAAGLRRKGPVHPACGLEEPVKGTELAKQRVMLRFVKKKRGSGKCACISVRDVARAMFVDMREYVLCYDGQVSEQQREFHRLNVVIVDGVEMEELAGPEYRGHHDISPSARLRRRLHTHNVSQALELEEELMRRGRDRFHRHQYSNHGGNPMPNNPAYGAAHHGHPFVAQPHVRAAPYFPPHGPPVWLSPHPRYEDYEDEAYDWRPHPADPYRIPVHFQHFLHAHGATRRPRAGPDGMYAHYGAQSRRRGPPPSGWGQPYALDPRQQAPWPMEGGQAPYAVDPEDAGVGNSDWQGYRHAPEHALAVNKPAVIGRHDAPKRQRGDFSPEAYSGEVSGELDSAERSYMGSPREVGSEQRRDLRDEGYHRAVANEEPNAGFGGHAGSPSEHDSPADARREPEVAQVPMTTGDALQAAVANGQSGERTLPPPEELVSDRALGSPKHALVSNRHVVVPTGHAADESERLPDAEETGGRIHALGRRLAHIAGTLRGRNAKSDGDDESGDQEEASENEGRNVFDPYGVLAAEEAELRGYDANAPSAEPNQRVYGGYDPYRMATSVHVPPGFAQGIRPPFEGEADGALAWHDGWELNSRSGWHEASMYSPPGSERASGDEEEVSVGARRPEHNEVRRIADGRADRRTGHEVQRTRRHEGHSDEDSDIYLQAERRPDEARRAALRLPLVRHGQSGRRVSNDGGPPPTRGRLWNLINQMMHTRVKEPPPQPRSSPSETI